jgi:hypothetical protein
MWLVARHLIDNKQMVGADYGCLRTGTPHGPMEIEARSDLDLVTRAASTCSTSIQIQEWPVVLSDG